MTRPITPTDLLDALDGESGWRKRELSFLKTSFQRAQGEHRAAIGRASHVALYAHWEGFVREAAQLYLYHISFRSQPLGKLKTGITFAAYPNALAQAQNVGDNAILKVKMLDELFELHDRRLKNKKLDVNTRSNLGMAVLEELDCVLGDVGLSEGIDKTWLDEKLLKKRNTIAHGRSALIDFDEFNTLFDLVIGWMESIKAALVNAALAQRYLAA